MITERDISALADLLARLPMTRAEVMYSEALLKRLQMMAPPKQEPKPEPGETKQPTDGESVPGE